MPEAPHQKHPLFTAIVRPGPSQLLALGLALLMLVLTGLDTWLFEWLKLEKVRVSDGELWRLLTANLVHYGWSHTLMNLAALLVGSYALFLDYPWQRFALLVLGCSLSVGLGMWLLDSDYESYAGFSGVMHGLILAGIIHSRAHPLWLRLAAFAIVIAKLVQEQSPGYQATDLQAMLPVPVAVNSHVYGACAGVLIAIIYELLDYRISLTTKD